MLSARQIDHFECVGFLRLPGIIPYPLVAAAQDALIADFAKPTMPFSRNSNGQVSKIYSLHTRNKAYWRIATMPTILEILRDILGEHIVYTVNRHNHGERNNRDHFNFVRLHRDVPNPGHVTVAVYLNDATVDNGATLIIPGSHRWPHAAVKDDGIWLDSIGHPYSDLHGQAVQVAVDAGGIIVFNSYAYHSTGANMTTVPRDSLIFGFEPVHERLGVVAPHQILVSGADQDRGNIVFRRQHS